jgi:dephospho-CoA kinase
MSLYHIILYGYVLFGFCILVFFSIIIPRVTKNDKGRLIYIYGGFYGINTVLLNYLFKVNPLKTILLNVILLIFSQLIGSRLRFIGLTGQISSGKSTVAHYLENKYQAAIIDVDKLNKEVLEDQKVKAEIRKIFGDDVFDQENNLKKLEMRKIIFNDINKKRKLESITHFRVFKMLLYRLFRDKILYRNKYVVIENALLLRFLPLKLICFPILAVCTSKKAEIIARVMERDGCDRETAENILNNQISKEEFIDASDYVIFNDTDKGQLRADVDKFMSYMK